MKTLNRNCRKANEFISYAQSHNCHVVNGNGSHVKVYSPDNKSMIPIPCHCKDLGAGLAAKIYKWFVIIGIAIMLIAVLYLNSGGKI